MDTFNVGSLRPGEAAPPLCIRVIRKWVPNNRDNELHFLFVDREGFGIQAMAKDDERKVVEPKLSLSSCYRIENYACIEPDNYTNTLVHPALIIFGSSTQIMPVPDCPDIQKHYFEIATRRMAETKVTYEGIIDYIGIVRSIKDRFTVKNQPYVVLTMRDISNQDTTVASWEETCTRADRFDRQIIENATPPVIIAMTGLKAKRLTAYLQLQTTRATYTYLAPAIMETEMLKTMFASVDFSKAVVNPPIETTTSIIELKQMPTNALLGKNFVVNGTITHAHIDKTWYYTKCLKCAEKSYPAYDKWYCPPHGNLDDTNFMYRIPITIDDKTEFLEATMFDKAATQLLEISCKEMYSDSDARRTIRTKITAKPVQFTLRPVKDDRTGLTTYSVNNAMLLHQTKATAVTSSSTSPTIGTPTPTTPAPTTASVNEKKKDASARRKLFGTGAAGNPAKKPATN